jgi:3-oxoacyl-[acyl-carrier-protein] synthase-3
MTVAMLARRRRSRPSAAGLGPGHHGIVLATATPDRLLPATACDLQALLGAKNAAAFDVSAACPGFLFALTVAEGLVASGQGENFLIVGAEKLNTIADPTDRSTAILFGDAAGAAIVRKSSGGPRGVLSTFIKSDGTWPISSIGRVAGGGPDQRVVAERPTSSRWPAGKCLSAVLTMSEACDMASSARASPPTRWTAGAAGQPPSSRRRPSTPACRSTR